MADRPINLNRARKARARDAARKAADANAAKFGRPKAERARDAAEAARDTARIEGHRREAGADRDPDGQRDGHTDGQTNGGGTDAGPA